LLSGKSEASTDETTTISNLLTINELNEFLRYYVEDSVSSLDDTDELKNIVIGNEKYAGLCANATTIVSYETEFINMAKFVDIATDSSKPLVQIGEIIDKIKGDSVLIPSILDDVVVYYVNKNVPSEYSSAKTLITQKLKPTEGETVTITSYAKEFEYMAKLKELAEQNPIKLVRSSENDSLVAGELFNKLVFGKTADETIVGYKSVILTHDVVDEILKVVIGTQLNNKGDINDDLKTIVSGIKDNVYVSAITNYEMEFKHMDALLEEIGGSSVSLLSLGQKLDAAVNDGSKLFNTTIIGRILEYFFDDNMKAYKEDSDYKDVVGTIKNKVLGVVDRSETNKYASMLAEVEALKTNLGKLQAISTYDQFKENAVAIGGYLDNIEAMTWVSDKATAKSIATIVFNKMKKVAKAKIPATEVTGNKDGEAIVNDILNNDKYKFDNHATEGTPKGTADDETNYYTQIMTDIKAELDKISVNLTVEG
jgi:hypothetical protein